MSDARRTEDLAPRDRELVAAAREVRARAHAPYSRFSVGAALRDRAGEIFRGVNVENASLGLTVCAERNAVARAVADGSTEFDAIAVAAGGDGTVSPCGACRQVLHEFAPTLRVLLARDDGFVEEHGLDDLLPAAFDAFSPEGSE